MINRSAPSPIRTPTAPNPVRPNRSRNWLLSLAAQGGAYTMRFLRQAGVVVLGVIILGIGIAFATGIAGDIIGAIRAEIAIWRTGKEGELAVTRLEKEIRETKETAVLTPLPMQARQFAVPTASIRDIERNLRIIGPEYFTPGTDISEARANITAAITALLASHGEGNTITQTGMDQVLPHLRPILNANAVIDDQSLRKQLVVSALLLDDLKINVGQ